MERNNPLITVVTVVFNGAKLLDDTIQSIINQTYRNIEYIVIDGCSTDGTLDIIEKYREDIILVSEHDKGIYDAMNKGIALAKGEWINFMNAGDSFYSLSSVADVFEGKNYDEDVLFGNVNTLYPESSRIITAGNPKNLWRGMQFCHQSVFVRTVIQKQNLFNVSSLSADFQFFYGIHESNVKFTHIDFVIASVMTGGVSDLNRIQVIEEWRSIVCSRGCNMVINTYYVFFKLIVRVIDVLKHLFPKKIMQLLSVNN